ncbi:MULTISPECIES: B12-binding domain-containing protein [Desulfitobacterium]|uniref:Putative cobalamin binding protein n=1 Tax=Desulfitobacterium dehalogenans (strain ATCC 51507 / DSM 9161 / JW/IU-DC1) TaxID=756499 RepID=I4ACD7_DESDJ|nr:MULTISPECIES: cobalamin-dependent protein [Desulfitobacterium]AFM01622.1 putative cobalamin binding protein [Desulfitobacterium dehalogenans ATCC 51507]
MLDLNALTQAIGDLDEGQVVSLLEEFVESKPSMADANQVVAACQKGMSIVGDFYEKKEYYVGDLIFAGELLSQAFDILKPVIGGDNTQKVGSIVVGTVQGDMHDIGKNIFASMVEAAGFDVYDLGIDVEPAVFVEKVKELKAEVLGMSGVLTLAIDSMKATVEALEAAGIRDQVKVIIGGNPVTEEACKQIGADMFTTNAAEGVKICQRWVE